jgi:hypothetical protein
MAAPNLEGIYPTLFVGLGGAGGHVLGRLNRLFQAEFGAALESGSDASPLQFLLLDTDDFEKLDEEVRDGLGGAERNFLSLSHFNPRRYAERQLSITDSDVHRWLDRNALRYLDDAIIHDGASRLRQLGRLCLHYHYERVEQRIRDKIDRALDADVHTRAVRIKPEPRPIRVFLVTSSCGGTGSGTFLDVAMLISRIVRDRGAVPDMQAFVYLPFPFIEANAQIDPALEPFYQHNAWAFFEELNYFIDNPERMPEHVLDPHRRLNDPARPAGDYGLDIFRTVYLIGNHVPPVGTLKLGGPLHSYVANGIFHTFLTPEEGSIQSHYSNIKAKLKDKDRIHRLPKRFATFGYAEYRRRNQGITDHLVREAVAGDWNALLGPEATPEVIHAEAGALTRALRSMVTDAINEAKGWSLSKLGDGAFITGDPLDKNQMVRRVNGLLADADAEREAKAKELKDDAEAMIPRVLEARLRERLLTPPRGLRTELCALQALRAEVGRLISELDVPAIEPLVNDPQLTHSVAEIRAKIPEPGKKYRVIGPLQANERGIDTVRKKSDALIDRVRTTASEQLETQTKRAVREVLRDTIDQRLSSLIDRLQRAVGWLGEERPVPGGASALVVSPTIQEVPPADVVQGNDFVARAEAFRRVHEAIVAPQRRDLWAGTLDRGGLDSVRAFRLDLETLWTKQVTRVHGDKGIREWITDWAEQLVTRQGNRARTAKDIERGLLARLLPLSTPACTLDRAMLDKADTVPEIVAVVGPFSDEKEAEQELSIRGHSSLIGSPASDRIAVLQTWYAFSSRAIEGMETLRSSYLKRDRTNSLPHVHKDWNDCGLTEHVDAAARYSPEELGHVVRMLALSRHFRTGELPGITVQRDERDADDARYLLEYRAVEGKMALRWRDIRIMPDFRNRVELPLLNGSRGFDAPYVNGLGWDLERDLAAYLGAEPRQRHAQLLGLINELEHTPDHGPKYRATYAAYEEYLNDLIRREVTHGRERYLPMLRRLADALHVHRRMLQEAESPLLAEEQASPA